MNAGGSFPAPATGSSSVNQMLNAGQRNIAAIAKAKPVGFPLFFVGADGLCGEFAEAVACINQYPSSGHDTASTKVVLRQGLNEAVTLRPARFIVWRRA